jgi:TPR repeat protein
VQSYKNAAYWFKKAANQGNADAQYNLGVCYENGHGVKKDLQKAKFWKDKSGLK